MATSTQGGDGCLEALPVAALLCGTDARVRDLNRIARETFRVEENKAADRQLGEVIRCATASRHACGEGATCTSCSLWKALGAALAGETVAHREVVLPILGEDGATRHVFLCSAAPAPGREAVAVVVLQDITELQRLPELIAICAQCKLVRHDGEWLTLGNYIEECSHALFTHTLCPACEAIYYREIGGEPPPPTGGPAGEG